MDSQNVLRARETGNFNPFNAFVHNCPAVKFKERKFSKYYVLHSHATNSDQPYDKRTMDFSATIMVFLSNHTLQTT
mgnify:CR=1 FL=1